MDEETRMKGLLTSTEVRALLRVHKRTLQRWRDENLGPEYFKGSNGNYLYLGTSVHRFVKDMVDFGRPRAKPVLHGVQYGN